MFFLIDRAAILRMTCRGLQYQRRAAQTREQGSYITFEELF